MKIESWLQSTDWDDTIEKLFESKIQHQRQNYHKAQTIAYKAGRLLYHSAKHDNILIGIRLYKRILNEYKTEECFVVEALQSLADYYNKIKDYPNAINHYDGILSRFIKNKTRSWTDGMSDIRYAEMLLQTDIHDKIQQMYDYLKNIYATIDSKFLNTQSVQHACYKKVLSLYHHHFKEYKLSIKCAKEALSVVNEYAKTHGMDVYKYFDSNFVQDLINITIEIKISQIEI